MKLSRHSEYAFRTLIFLALEPDQKFRIEDIAKAHNIPRNHLVKVVAHLVKKGYVATHRGRYGGVSLGRSADTILMGDLIHEMDHLNKEDNGCSECLMRPIHHCPIESACQLSGILDEASKAFYTTLNRSTLAQQITHSEKLHSMLGIKVTEEE
jgi:Rrf2 family nitric oxide-sensitive transcriptional repressor